MNFLIPGFYKMEIIDGEEIEKGVKYEVILTDKDDNKYKTGLYEIIGESKC